ncbi:hypothetical protein [uncultured Desulfuromusa sp.]|uniref:hypothetical protein n=1 Tax=uncultured Desulfuromusa sp. TaxID=219183 RepID=UPI002AA79F8E|nr:hypothetical protein [uncultured Desulfuromusa sp.]
MKNELVSHEQVGDVYKVIGEVSGQLVFFDFSTMSLIENYPVSMAKNHVVNLSKNVKSEGEKILADVYLGTHDHESILNLAAKILSEIKINESTGVRFQVKNIKISENVINTLNKKTNIDKLRKYVGYFFSSRLKNKYDVVVLPFLKDYSVSNTMSGRFSNGDIYNLKVPEPDYSFNISIKKIKKKQFKNSNMIYACQIHFTMEDTFQNSKYIDGYYHYSVPKLLLDNQENTDDTSAYIDAIESLLDELVIQLAKPNKKWLKLHGGNNTSYDQFNAKRRLFHEK